MFKSVMDMFKPASAQVPVSEVQVPNASNGVQQTAPNPLQTPEAAAAAEQQKADATQVSPLDSYKTLWDTPAKKEGEEDEFNPSQIFQMDQSKIQEALSKVDFASSVSQTQMEAIQAGGPEAMKAMMEMLNGVARQTMGAATTASAKMVEQAMTKAASSMDKRVEKVSRNQQVSSHLRETNPLLSHPATAPMVQALQTQFSQQYPKATPAEIAEHVGKYMTEISNIASGKSKEEETSKAKAENEGTDWMAYYGEN